MRPERYSPRPRSSRGACAPSPAASAMSRRFDTLTSGLGMDAMNRLFSNDFAALRALRDLGLRIVDRSGPLKRRLIAEAAGDGAQAPRLLRGLGL